MTNKLFLFCVFMLCNSLVFGQGVRFTAEVGQPVVGTGEQFALTFSINANGESFNPPNFGSFQVLAGPNLSTSMTSVNGNTTISTSYSFILMASKEGEFTFGAASIEVNGRHYTSNSVKIKVVKGHPVQQQQQQNSGGQTDMDNSAIETKAGALNKSIFIRAVVDKTNVYEGQQVVVSYRLYTRVGIDDSQINILPELNGFFSQDIKNMQQQQRTVWNVETYKGQRYNVTDIKQSILFPEHAGNLTVDPLGATFLVRQPVPSRNFMDSFFDSYKEVNLKVKSPPVTVHVKPLPEGKPAGFTGAIGNFSIKANVDKTKLKANESLNYNIVVSGSGNLKLLKNIVTEFPASFEKYDPKITDTITDAISGESGSRRYNYLLIPRQQGMVSIAPVKFSYFNPALGRYITLETKPFNIEVEKGKEQGTVTSFATDRQFEGLAGRDIYNIKTADSSLSLKGNTFFGSAAYWLLLFLGPAGCVAAFACRNRYRRLNSDEVKVKSRKAGKIAALRLAKAQKELAGNNPGLFYAEIFKGLYGYLGDKLNIPYANLDKENIAVALKSRQVDDSLIKQVVETIHLCEMAQFAPVKHISKEEVFESTKNLIDNIEAKLK